MILKISNDAATAGLPINPPIASSGAHARRNSESKASTSAPEAADIADCSLDIPDAKTADAIMASLRAGILAQPGTAIQAQGGLSPRSVYDLLQ